MENLPSQGSFFYSVGGCRQCLLAKKKTAFKEPLLSVLMWGVNHTIGQLDHVPPPGLLMPDDFKAYSKVKIDNHYFNKDVMPSHYKVSVYG